MQNAKLIISPKRNDYLHYKTLKGMKKELLQNALNPKRIKGILWKEEN